MTSNNNLNIETIKDLTGGTKFTTRGLYDKDMFEIDNKLTIIMEANKIPITLKVIDNSKARRFIIIPFERIFTTKKEEVDGVNYFISDPYIGSKEFIEDNKLHFFNYIVRCFEWFKKIDFNFDEISPESVKLFTQKTLQGASGIVTFINENYKLDSSFKPADDSKNNTYIDKFINVSTIYEDYIENCEDKIKLKKKEFFEAIEKDVYLKRFFKKRYHTYIYEYDDEKKKFKKNRKDITNALICYEKRETPYEEDIEEEEVIEKNSEILDEFWKIMKLEEIKETVEYKYKGKKVSKEEYDRLEKEEEERLRKIMEEEEKEDKNLSESESSSNSEDNSSSDSNDDY